MSNDPLSDLRLQVWKLTHEAVRRATVNTYRRAQVLSSGTRSLAQLAKMDHPYATRHPVMLLPDDIINVQSGRFKNAWKWTASGFEGMVTNDDPKVEYLTEGTERMHPRRIDVTLMKYAEKNLEREVEKALAKL